MNFKEYNEDIGAKIWGYNNSDELKQLIEDAAKLLGLKDWVEEFPLMTIHHKVSEEFNPLNPERGDLMKVAEAAKIGIQRQRQFVYVDLEVSAEEFQFNYGDHQSLALAILRAASAVLKARNENAE